MQVSSDSASSSGLTGLVNNLLFGVSRMADPSVVCVCKIAASTATLVLAT